MIQCLNVIDPILMLPIVVGIVAALCRCCASCDYFTDDFSADNLATDWDDRAGTWAVGSGVLSTTSASALIVTTTESGATATGVYVEVLIRCATTSDIARVVAAYVDDDNYWFAELQPGASNGTLKLFERAAGSNTQRGPTATILSLNANDQAALSICISPGAVTTVAVVGTDFGSNSAGTAYAATVSVDSTKAGVGTGSGSSDVEFDSFVFGKHSVDDPLCYSCSHSCDRCTDSANLAPDAIQLVGTGFADAGLNCDHLNATFIIGSDPGLSCAGYQSTFPAFTDMNCTLISIYLNSSAAWVMTTSCSGFPFAAYNGTSATGVSRDCLAWNSEAVVPGSFAGGCSGAGGSFAVTAL